MQTSTLARPRPDRSAGRPQATTARGWIFLAALAVSLAMWAGLVKLLASAL